MMCGLPGAGKTHWVREFVQKNPEKRYTIIGNTQLLEKMTVSCLDFKGKANFILHFCGIGGWNTFKKQL